MQQRQKLKVKSLFGKYEEYPIDWQVKTFDELFKFLRTGSNSRDDLQETGDVHYIHYGDIHAKWRSVLDCDLQEIPRIDKSKVQDLPILKDGDLIIVDASEDYEGSGASILLRNVKNRKIVSGLHTIVLRNIDENISPDFKTYLNSIKFVKNQIIAYVTGISVYGLSKNNLKKIRIPLPPLKEQQKIATILSKADELIQKTEQIIEQTQSLKKGLMQRLLTKGIGHTKFKKIETSFNLIDFVIPENWRIERLENISLEIKDGPMGFNLHNYDYVEKGIPILRIQNLKDLYVTKEDLRYISIEKHEELKKSQIKENDIIISKTGIIGVVGIVPIGYGAANLNQALARISLYDQEMVFFVALFLSSSIPQKILSIVGSGRTIQAGLKMSDIKNLPIPIPPKKELKEIITNIVNLDSLLKIEKNSLLHCQSLKKGLMQQLLTGKIRVKV